MTRVESKNRSTNRWRLLAAVLLIAALFVYAATPYVRAASLFVRVAHIGGRVERFASEHAHAVTVLPRHAVTTRHGDVAAQFYRPDGTFSRTVLLVPGIHSMGIDEPRLTALARDLAGSGVMVMTLALPDLQQYRITPRATDVIEDAVAWTTARPDLAPDGKVGIVGISFAGGLAIVAAGRPTIADKLVFVVSFGGHGDLPRVMRYLATGEETHVPGVENKPPHDYGVAVILYGLADQGVVPPDQVAPLRAGVEIFLLASQLTLRDMNQANATFQKARDYAKTLPAPAATFMTYVNDRNARKLGPALVPYLGALGADSPALSADRAPSPPKAPVFLLHGSGDTVIPAAESILLADDLRRKGVDVHLLLSELITHAEVDRTAAAAETWKLVSFWANVLKR
jgi:dienelactone hydrolase